MKLGSCDDLIFEALQHANKPKEKKMNILIQNIDRETVEKISELLEMEVNKKLVKKEGLLDYMEKWEKKFDLLKEEYNRDIERMNKRFAEGKLIRVIKRRPFNEAMIDSEYDRVQDQDQEQRWEEERDDDIERREEFETKL